MTLQQLRFLIAVAESGSINAAAQRLYTAQSNISNAVKSLEQELHIEIFTRSSRGVALTNDGTELLGYARQVIEQADKYKTVVSRYEAEIYIKGKTEILKQNILMRFAHHLFPVDRKNKDMIFEMVSHSKFNAPNNYLHSFEAINGNSIPNGAKQQEVLTFLNLNVYSPTIYNEGIIMPVALSLIHI